MFGADKAVGTSSRHWRTAVALGCLLPWGSVHAGTCGSGSVQSALTAPQISEKFALANDFCGRVPTAGNLAPEAAQEPVPGPAPVSAHAQQLWLYDRPAVAPGVAGSEPAAPAVQGASVQAGRGRRDTAEILRAPKGMGRESVSRALALVPQITQVAEQFGIDPLLLHAIAHVESRHNPDAVSHAGAVGLMQVMPATARRFGVTAPHSQLRDPRISLEVSSAYLKNLQKRFDNDLTLVIAAYNAGEGAVEKYGRRVPPYKETQGYVRDVMAHYRLLLAARDSVRPALQAAS